MIITNKNKIKNTKDISTVLSGLDILFKVSNSYFIVFDFASKIDPVTLRYGAKKGIKLGVGIGFAYLGNILGKLAIEGICVFFGVTLGPSTTIIIRKLSNAITGYIGSYIGEKIADTIFGKDEFILTSPHLYYKYIPEKYKQKYWNPCLKWNKSYLCANVKTYVIECVINNSDVIMSMINIPNNVYEINEHLTISGNVINNSSLDTSLNLDNSKVFKDSKFIGNLIIPYQGINRNCSKINFIIYGTNKEHLSYEEWQIYKTNKQIFEIIFDLSVF